MIETVPLLHNRRVLLGVTGGIAVYKICTLASHLTQAGAKVDVVMTEAATRFVSPLTFEALTGRPSYTTLWRTAAERLPTHIEHVGLAEAADILVIAPATANSMAKMVHGIADNLLSTLTLAVSCPVLVAPAMDARMWSHPATQENAAKLRRRGVYFAGPARGRMASGLEGEGRMAEPDEILGKIRFVLGLKGQLAGFRLLVTAGPTREPMDPVRFLSNFSSGRQGFALAQAAIDRGAEVTLITGPTHLSTPVGAQRIDVTTAEEMQSRVLKSCEQTDVLIMTAAVSDYRPVSFAPRKIKKTQKEMALRLTNTADILSAVSAGTPGIRPRLVVGFAAESENLMKNARKKLEEKKIDLIVANDITARDAGFEAETNRVTLLDRKGDVQEIALMSKALVSEAVLDRVVSLLKSDSEKRNSSIPNSRCSENRGEDP